MEGQSRHIVVNGQYIAHMEIDTQIVGVGYVYNINQPSSLKPECSEAPSHDNAEDVTPDDSSSVSPASHAGNPRGPRAQILFMNEYGREDTTRTATEAARVLKYIADHHMGNLRLDSKATNRLNLLLCSFWLRWKELHFVSAIPQGAALYRFATDQCHLPCDVLPRAFTSKICELINAGKNDPEIYDNLRAYFPELNTQNSH